MSSTNQPSVLIIDDLPGDQGLRIAELGKKARVRGVHPEEVAETMLIDADLVLVDYVLEHWPERDASESISRIPLDGFALAAILRGHTLMKTSSPTALAIYSARLDELSRPLPSEPREHVIARAHNLEWVFSKVEASQGVPLAEQIASLASAVKLLPKSWPSGNEAQTRGQVQKLLGLPDQPWTEQAWEETNNCYPPIHELSEWTHGLAFVRWMLHRILPYPCFLLDATYLAARLRISPLSLVAEYTENSQFRRMLANSEYKGMLAGFLGPRWWRAGVETTLWKLTKGNSFDTKALHNTLRQKGARRLRPAGMDQPVVCLDENYRPTDNFGSYQTAVRVQPDDWPPYADQAWIPIELARSAPRLHALVIQQDRDRIDTNRSSKRRK
jgi:hypothetical protein